MLMLNLQQLELIQGLGGLLLLLCLGFGALYLLLGLFRPALVGRGKRRWVVAWTFALWMLGLCAYVGTVAFTHSHPNGPHAFQGYWGRYLAEQCATGAELAACPAQKLNAPNSSAESAAPTQ